MKLLGIVVLYRPKREFVANIRSYLKGVDRLIVWLNSAVDKDSLSLMERDNVIILGTGENLGIGAALNKAVAYALDNGFTHLLTMDQDSSFDPVTFCKYRDEIDLNTDNKVGCFAPDHGWNDIDDKTGIVKTTITSGAVYPISVFNEVGLFRDDFVIDGIDTEFCYRLRSKGYSISCVRHIGMNHHLGNSTLFKIGRYTFSSINYPPLRNYYILRNHMIVRSLYEEYGKKKGFYKYFLYRRMVQILLLEPNKWFKLKALFFGLIHGFLGKTGSCKVKLE